MQKPIVWLIRHGESSMNTGAWTNSPATAALTSKGHTQAKEAAKQITTQPDLIVRSPFLRAEESTIPILAQWPNTPLEIWPIQEFTYIAPAKFENILPSQRRAIIDAYWHQADPSLCDETDAESFENFIQRVQDFAQRLSTQKGFLIVIGHGQFFKAYQLGLIHGFSASSAWMKKFRQEETKQPIKNSEIIKLL